MQLGPPAAEALLAGEIAFKRSPTNQRVRNVLVDGVHVASVRARDGLLSLRFEGGERIRAAAAPPTMRLVLETDAVPFVAEGKNPMARFVEAADAALRPGDECLLVSPSDELVAVGRMLLAGWEVEQVQRGPAARTRGRQDAADA
jgi:archaeosine-15-forming tRNA-guanine transglycosylase